MHPLHTHVLYLANATFLQNQSLFVFTGKLVLQIYRNLIFTQLP
jgi:hypothetical protein